jgi:hypothetical protein
MNGFDLSEPMPHDGHIMGANTPADRADRPKRYSDEKGIRVHMARPTACTYPSPYTKAPQPCLQATGKDVSAAGIRLAHTAPAKENHPPTSNAGFLCPDRLVGR